ncbi:MAG: TIGR03032 family protein [Phaeodactylibacter sp.]|nr:TIGR03032 family protein [Phaeodactylibacter sp.]MCB9051380.1 TIGR03032 family protein [Lewinellaceae bacterium]
MSGGQPKVPAPFSCTYSPNIPELLQQLNCTLALSTYQAGKVVLLSSLDGERLIQLPRTFRKPMGIALEGHKMAIATLDEAIVLANSPELAQHYTPKPATYDALYMPRATYYTGQVDIHDLEWGAAGLYAVNTSFSCICRIDDNYSFTPFWKPSFISKLAHEDRCHLNGMAMAEGRPRFASAFNTGDSRQSWRENITETGVLIDIHSNEIIAGGLPMPHSPRLFDGRLFVLLSASGELAEVDIDSGKTKPVCRLDGFVRGMCRCEDYVFVGLSRLRQNSSTFAKLPFAHQAKQAGIAVVHLPTGALSGFIRYQSSVDEIYDVRVLPGLRRPNILNPYEAQHRLGLSTPEATYWANPPSDH